MLFEKAEIKKRSFDRNEEDSRRIKQKFVERYNNVLNDALSVTILNSKENVLRLKERMVSDLKRKIKKEISSKIEDNYDQYIDYILDTIKTINTSISKSSEIVIMFNSKDYSYFKTNFSKLNEIISTIYDIQEIDIDIIGGFKVYRSNEKVSYDYSIDTIIEKKSTVIQKEFMNIISDTEIREIELKFEKFINEKKKRIEEYFNNYEQL